MEALMVAIWVGILGNAAWFLMNALGNRALKRGQADLRRWQERLQEWLHGNPGATKNYGGAFAVPKKAIVYTVGGQSATINLSISKQNPDFIGLICSEQTKGVAEEVANSFPERERCKLEICDPSDIVDIRDKTRIIFGWLARKGINPSDAVLDPTGGMTNMSVGAYSVAEEMGIDSQYLRSDFDGNNRRLPGTENATYISRHLATPTSLPTTAIPLKANNSEPPAIITLSLDAMTDHIKQEDVTNVQS